MKRFVFLSALQFVLFSLLMLSGCRSVKEIGTVGLGVPKSSVDFFDSMLKQSFQYNTLSARIQAEIETPKKSFSSRVDLRMVKDSVFQLSVVPFPGVEAFRAEFSRDSAKMLDRLNKRYVAESYDNMKGELPVDFNFYNLQALFTNHLFLPGEQNVKQEQYKRFLLDQSGLQAKITTRDVMDLLYTFKADGEEKLLSLCVADTAENHGLQWDYGRFRQIDEDRVFPMLMNIRVIAKNAVAGNVSLVFGHIEPDVSVRMAFLVPNKYKRVTFAQLIKDI